MERPPGAPDGVWRHIEKRNREPWSGLKTSEINHGIFTPEIKPLSHSQLETVTDRIVVPDYRSGVFSRSLRETNSDTLSTHASIAVVLDGRSPLTLEGYLGDMIEAARIVDPIRSMGKDIIIITPHQDLFADSNGVDVLTMPSYIPGSPRYPWNEQLKQFIYENLGDTPVAFPLNASLPAFVQFEKGGGIGNKKALSIIREAVHPDIEKPTISQNNWWNRGLHQLQALQTAMYLMGIQGMDSLTEFPNAYLNPLPDSVQRAEWIIRRHNCFNGSDTSDRFTLFIHPGVAVGGRKLVSKNYPEKKWKEVLDLLADKDCIKSVIFLRPSNEEQAEMTECLAAHAVGKGILTSLIPQRGEQSATEWSLGTFIAFLQKLSECGGIVLGVDSMPAGHAAPATGNPSVVLGSLDYNPNFYCPGSNARVVITKQGTWVQNILPEQVTEAVYDLITEIRSKRSD